MANNNNFGASFAIDTTNLKAGLAQANRLIRESESEFKAAAAGMDDWSKSEEGLNAKIKSLNDITEIQRKKVDALQDEYDKLIDEGMDPTSKAAVELRTKINNETAALNKNESELKKQTEALENLEESADDAGDAAEDMGGKFDKLKALGAGVAGAVAGIATACVAAVGSFLSLAESTREARNEMAKLETSFQTAGLSAKDASTTFTNLYGILGDEGAAVEAAQQLAKISKDEKDLALNTKILTGVMAEYGNSIPTEGLAEGIAATAAMSSVQGPLADALEWQGVNLDTYNEKLASLATEEERSAYIQKTLLDLYGESAEAYEKNNADIIAANKAQAELNESLNELGAIAEPIMTTIKLLAADLLKVITPFVSLIGEGLTGALNGTEGATKTLAKGLGGLLSSVLSKVVEIAPFIIETIAGIIPILLKEILAQLPTILKTLITMITKVAKELGVMLKDLIPVVIDTVLLLVETLLDNLDLIIDAGIELLLGLADGLIIALPRLIEKIPVIIEKLMTALSNNLPKLVQAGIKLTVNLALGLIKAIPQLISKIPQIITSLVKGFANYYKNLATVGINLIKGVWDGMKDLSWIKGKIKGWVGDVLSFIKNLFGIHSPSEVMADQVGKNLALGIGVGFERNIGGVNRMISGAMSFEDAKLSASGVVSGVQRGGVTINQTNNYTSAHSRYELYKTKQQTEAAVRLAIGGA